MREHHFSCHFISLSSPCLITSISLSLHNTHYRITVIPAISPELQTDLISITEIETLLPHMCNYCPEEAQTWSISRREKKLGPIKKHSVKVHLCEVRAYEREVREFGETGEGSTMKKLEEKRTNMEEEEEKGWRERERERES